MKLRSFILPGTVLASAIGLLLAPIANVPLANAAPVTGSSAGPDAVTGQDALAKGPGLLNIASAKSGLSVDRLKNLLRGDNGLWIDRQGSPFFVEPSLTPQQKADSAAERPAPAAGSAAAPAPAPADAFALHSRPGSAKTIFLDFDGAVITGTAWNDSSHPSYDAKPFDTDGDPSSFSDSERKAIIESWQRVSEDYAVFDVDVTTADPGDAALNRSSASDNVYGSHVVITPTTDVRPGVGGVAYVGTFNSANNGQNQPAWVFSSNLSNVASNIAEAATHEVGHNLGLSHDGDSQRSYSRGQGIWAPIMGAAYGKPLSQWSNGDYKDANNREDDLSVIAGHGLSYIPANHGTSTASASVMAKGSSYNGTILSRTDVAYYKVVVSASGAYTFAATPPAVGANLDIKLSLLDANGTQLDSNNPVATKAASSTAAGIDAKLSGTLAPGTYYLTIDGVGQGDPQVDGYSDYGSIGSFTLAVS